MKTLILAFALALSAGPVAAQEADFQPESFLQAGQCDLNAAIFANQQFNQRANAVAKCNELEAQTGFTKACTVQRLNNGKFVANFIKNFVANNAFLQQLLAQLQVFVLSNNVFLNNNLKLQVQIVGTNCQ